MSSKRNKRFPVRRAQPVIIKTPSDESSNRKREANDQVVSELSQKIKRLFDESNSDRKLLQFDINWNHRQGLNLKVKFKNLSPQESMQQVALKVSGGNSMKRSFMAGKSDKLFVPGTAAVSRVHRQLFGNEDDGDEEEEEDEYEAPRSSSEGMTPSTSGSSIGEHHLQEQQEQPSMEELIDAINLEQLNEIAHESVENTEKFQQLAYHVNELLKGYVKFFEQHPNQIPHLN